jgi:hypothetical protein
VSLALGTAVLGTGTAAAATSQTCTGTLQSPCVLAGTYKGNVVVTGLCLVNSGAAVIDGNLVIAADGAVGATYARNDVAGTGTSSLTVRGNVTVGSGGVMALGCDPAGEPCVDDQSATTAHRVLADPTADMIVSNHVGGSLACAGNSPAAQFAVGGSANVVRGFAAGQCGFTVKKPNPAPDGPLQPISVRG